MKGDTRIDHNAQTVAITLKLERIEDAGRAMELIRNAARACWPDILFNDEKLDGEEQEIESGPTPPELEPRPAWRSTLQAAETRKARSPEQTPRNFTRPPVPGSVSAFVLEACARLGTTEASRIAAELDMRVNTTAATIARLQRGGHLNGSQTCN